MADMLRELKSALASLKPVMRKRVSAADVQKLMAALRAIEKAGVKVPDIKPDMEKKEPFTLRTIVRRMDAVAKLKTAIADSGFTTTQFVEKLAPVTLAVEISSMPGGLKELKAKLPQAVAEMKKQMAAAADAADDPMKAMGMAIASAMVQMMGVAVELGDEIPAATFAAVKPHAAELKRLLKAVEPKSKGLKM